VAVRLRITKAAPSRQSDGARRFGHKARRLRGSPTLQAQAITLDRHRSIAAGELKGLYFPASFEYNYRRQKGNSRDRCRRLVMKAKIVIPAVGIAALLSIPAVRDLTRPQSPAPGGGSAVTAPRPEFGAVPLYFIPLRADSDAGPLFFADTADYRLWAGPAGLTFDAGAAALRGDERRPREPRIPWRGFQAPRPRRRPRRRGLGVVPCARLAGRSKPPAAPAARLDLPYAAVYR
jgi:hypothetical protein